MDTAKLTGLDPTFGVSEFVAVFNQTIEFSYPRVLIVGELANFRVSRGKWVYFDLKDELASVRFFGSVNALPGPLEDGLILEVSGRPRLHPNFGFSVNFDAIKVSGEGSIRKAKDLLKQKLLREGLFEEGRKRTLPYPPDNIGVISSAKSAGFADFKKIVKARWPMLKIKLKDVLVQGVGAPKQIIKAIREFNESPKPPDVVVIIRGGGSADDLSAFSEESVVRSVSSSRIPTLVAIGHDVDESLAELVADKRASTPSNAAELLVPDRKSELNLLSLEQKKLDFLIGQNIENIRQELALIAKTMGEILKVKFDLANSVLSSQKELLKVLDPKAPLKRGYALVSGPGGRVYLSKNVKPAQELSIELSDGIIKSKVKEVQRK